MRRSRCITVPARNRPREDRFSSAFSLGVIQYIKGVIMARILIVDDDSSIRALLREILEAEGHQVEEASNGKLGVLSYRANPTDLVITDILMPEKDGVELIMELQESFPAIKIIAMSGGGRGLDAQYNLRIAKDFGAVQQIEKPFTRKQVVETVRRAL